MNVSPLSRILLILHVFFALAVLGINRDGFAQSQPAIRFGATLSLTGSSAILGNACREGVELAQSEINRDGGIKGMPLQVLIEDFGDLDLKRAVSAAQKFLSVDKVAALLPNWSEDAEVFAPLARAHNVVSFALGAGGPGASRYSENSFRATTSDGELARASVRDARAFGARNACIFLANTNYYLDIGTELESAWRQSGGDVAARFDLPYVESNVSSYVTKMRGAGCDVVFAWAGPGTVAGLIRELRVQHVNALRVLPWYASSPEILKLANGDTNPYRLYRYSLANEEFISRFRSQFNHDPVRPAGNCYDGIRVLAHVMSQVGTDTQKVRDALLHLKGYQGVTGPFLIRSDREREGEIVERLELRGGRLEPLN